MWLYQNTLFVILKITFKIIFLKVLHVFYCRTISKMYFCFPKVCEKMLNFSINHIIWELIIYPFICRYPKSWTRFLNFLKARKLFLFSSILSFVVFSLRCWRKSNFGGPIGHSGNGDANKQSNSFHSVVRVNIIIVCHGHKQDTDSRQTDRL